MNSREVLIELDRLRGITSTNDRREKLAEDLRDPLFRKVVVYALDPFRTFGMSKKTFPNDYPTGSADFGVNSYVWELLDEMADRELTGNDAIRKIENFVAVTDAESVELLRRIILADLKAGFSAATVNKLVPGLVRSYDVMLASPYEEKRAIWPMAAEPKLDGMRCTVFVDAWDAVFTSRGGDPFESLDHLKEPMIEAFKRTGTSRRVAIDAEVVSGTFDETGVVRSKRSATDAVLYCFDIVEAELWDQEDIKHPSLMRLRERRRELEWFVEASGVEAIRCTEISLVSSHEEAKDHYAEMRRRGFEGSMLKDLDGRYVRRRSRDWMKLKAEETEDLRVLFAYEADQDSKYAGMLGGFTVNRNGVETRVGGGFSDKLRRELWEQWLRDPGSLQGRLIEVEFQEATKDGRLRHSRFIRFRDDKDGGKNND